MSVFTSSAVWSGSRQKGGTLIVLLAIADVAKDNGLAWPGVKYLARKSRMSERGVRLCVERLIDSGELKLERRGGGTRTNLYRVNVTLLQSQIQGSGSFFPGADDAEIEEIGAWGVQVTTLNTSQTSPDTPEEPSVEPSEDTTGADQSALFDAGPSEPSPSVPAVDPDDAKLEEVWANHVRLFGDRMRVKELTPPRRRTLLKALRAVGGDHTVLMRASEGLKFYRDGHPDGSSNVGIDVIFETGPHSTRNLTETIEWWASQSPGSSSERHDIPSVLRDRVRRRRVQIVEALRSPELSGAQERAEEAKRWLREHAHEEPVIEGTRVVEWRRV